MVVEGHLLSSYGHYKITRMFATGHPVYNQFGATGIEWISFDASENRPIYRVDAGLRITRDLGAPNEAVGHYRNLLRYRFSLRSAGKKKCRANLLKTVRRPRRCIRYVCSSVSRENYRRVNFKATELLNPCTRWFGAGFCPGAPKAENKVTLGVNCTWNCDALLARPFCWST